VEPLISVIVPVYNVEKYLERCVQSVMNQTYKRLEIILVDDGANDSSPQICDQLALIDKRIQVIHKPNGGLSSARNAGVEKATGDFITFIDSDDWIALDTYEYCIKLLDEKKADVVQYNYIMINEPKQVK
jgi:glycosyltransferase involved in cell wall biosynthesis